MSFIVANKEVLWVSYTTDVARMGVWCVQATYWSTRGPCFQCFALHHQNTAGNVHHLHQKEPTRRRRWSLWLVLSQYCVWLHHRSLHSLPCVPGSEQSCHKVPSHNPYWVGRIRTRSTTAVVPSLRQAAWDILSLSHDHKIHFIWNCWVLWNPASMDHQPRFASVARRIPGWIWNFCGDVHRADRIELSSAHSHRQLYPGPSYSQNKRTRTAPSK